MFRLLLSLLFVLSSTNCPNGLQRIIGGEICEIESYPFMVYISGEAECGGTLITLSHVLTAAHCVVPNLKLVRAGKMKVVAGCTHRTHEKTFTRTIKWAREHPKYREKLTKYDMRFDIGIMKTQKPFHESDTVNPIFLYKNYYNDCTEATTLGWGLLKPRGVTLTPSEENIKRDLHCVSLPLISITECKEYWPDKYILDDTMSCTLYKPGGKDACFGDSGGPLICRTAQIGIVSGGRGCALPNSPALFTRIDSFIDYIETTAKVKFVDVSNTHGNDVVRAIQHTPSSSNRNFLNMVLFMFFVLVFGYRNLGALFLFHSFPKRL